MIECEKIAQGETMHQPALKAGLEGTALSISIG